MPRMRIFTPAEQTAFDTPPIFTPSDRQQFFAIPESLAPLLDSLRTPVNKVRFLVSLGYFRAAKRFFARQFHAADVAYATKLLGMASESIDLEQYDRSVQSRHRQLILEYLGFRAFDDQAHQDMAHDIHIMVRSQMRPKQMLMRVVELLEQRKIEIPSAHVLTELVKMESARHKRVLIEFLDSNLSEAERALLDALLEKSDSGNEDQDQLLRRYRLTLLKKISQSTRPSKIRASVDDLRTLDQLYQQLEPTITKLDLSPEGIRYHAHAVLKSDAFHFARRHEDDRHLHLLCFTAHQFFRMHDALIDVLLSSVQTTLNICEREHKEYYYGERKTHRRTLKTFVRGVSEGAVQPLAEIETIAFCHELPDAEKVRHIQEVLMRGTLQRTLVQEQLAHFAEQSNTSEDAVYYDILEAKSIRLQNRASEIVKQIDLEGDDAALLAAIQHYKAKEGVISHTAPMAFLDPDEQQVVVEEKFRVSLYKALLFIKIAEAIKAGALNVKHSYRHRSLDDYMISRSKWEANRDDYLQRAGLTAAADWTNALQTWATRLDQQYHETNQRSLADQNPHTRFDKNGKWHLTTPKVEKPPRLPLLDVFPEKRYISLLEVLSTVNRFSHFLDGFEHWQGRYARPKPPDRTFYAGILGFGCFIGLPKMATISTRISEPELENVVNWYFSLETIQAANDYILQLMDQLELPEVYRRQPGKLHTSSDGQKFEVSVESLMATYSYKYFGQNQGVSAYNFLDERHFGFHSNVVSASEREAHYVIDGLMHNDVVKSDLHSTDTDGYTEILFGVLHLLGFEFAPRIKNVPGQRLYGFDKRKGYELHGYKLLPDAYINTELIAEQGDEILRFVATIKLKESTASQLFKRLNSYARQHPLYSALKEYGKIPKSDFLLRYVDDVSFRQAIEKQMNKIENANKFSRAIAFGNNQSFLYGDKIEQEMAEGCRRLIKNAIICWNYLYLTQKIAEAESEKRRHELLEAVKNGSVTAWQHVNLHGEYDFSDEKLQDSVGLHLPPELDIFGLHTEADAELGVVVN